VWAEEANRATLLGGPVELGWPETSRASGPYARCLSLCGLPNAPAGTGEVAASRKAVYDDSENVSIQLADGFGAGKFPHMAHGVPRFKYDAYESLRSK